MNFVKVEVGQSPLHDKGVFTKEEIKKGEIISAWTDDSVIINKAKYLDKQTQGDEIAIRSAVRLVDDLFLYYPDSEPSEDPFTFINHSEDENVLYHCGILFAKRNIKSGEELTINYRYILAENDYCRFKDKVSNKPIDGISGRKALIASAKELLDLFNQKVITSSSKRTR